MLDTQLETARADTGRIPVLDIGPYLAGEPSTAAPLARAVARTCEDTGFLVVANHGIAPKLVESAFSHAARFFARDEAVKLALTLRYEPTTYGEFSSRLLTLNFAHRRGETHQ